MRIGEAMQIFMKPPLVLKNSLCFPSSVPILCWVNREPWEKKDDDGAAREQGNRSSTWREKRLRRVEEDPLSASSIDELPESARWRPPCVQMGNRHPYMVSDLNPQSMEFVGVRGTDLDSLGPDCV